jgi:hypothetical protein
MMTLRRQILVVRTPNRRSILTIFVPELENIENREEHQVVAMHRPDSHSLTSS